jgi:hypothetical protein
VRAECREQELAPGVDRQGPGLAVELRVAAVRELARRPVHLIDRDALLGGNGDIDDGVGPRGGRGEQHGHGDDRKASHVPLSCGEAWIA